MRSLCQYLPIQKVYIFSMHSTYTIYCAVMYCTPIFFGKYIYVHICILDFYLQLS